MCGLITGGLTPTEEKQLTYLLSKVQQPYSRAFFETLMKLIPGISVECIVRRHHRGNMQILLTRRPADPHDPWQNAVHFAGTVARVTDESIEDMVRRTVEGELGCVPVSARFLYFEWRLGNGGRAATLHLVYDVTIDSGVDPLASSTWHDIDKIDSPDVPDLIPWQRDAIRVALTYV